MATVFGLASCSEEVADKHTVQKEPVDSTLTRREIHGEAQGTTYNIVYFTHDKRIPKYNVDSILDNIDLAASVWVDSSIISQANQSETEYSVVADSLGYFTDNFFLSKSVYELTNGAYNPTVGRLVNAWGFGFKNRENMDSSKVAELLSSVGFDDTQMWLDTNTNILHKTNVETQLDFNGIAQGYSVDVLADYFLAEGITSFMVEVGGELKTNGVKPDGAMWKIGIDRPEEGNLERQLAATLTVDNTSIATSGNYRKFYEVDGMRYAHTINPVTGFPVQHSLLSATVMTPNCGLADAYATAFMVMGVEKAIEFIESHQDLNLEVYFIYSDEDGKLKSYISEGMKTQLTEI